MMKRTTYLLVWTVALSSLVSCITENVAVDVEPAVLEVEPESVAEIQELDEPEPEAAIVEEEPATDDGADRPAQSAELDADSIVLTHSDGIRQPDDVEDWVAFTTAPAESEADVTWVTLTCTGEEDAVKAVRMTLWDAGGELDVSKACSASPKALELEAGHDYLARVHFKEEGAFSADYSLAVSHTTRGLVAQPIEEWVSKQISDAIPTVSFEGDASSPSTSINWCCAVRLDDDVLRDALMSVSCVGDSQAFEWSMIGPTDAVIGQVACNAPPVRVTLDPTHSTEDHLIGAKPIESDGAEVDEQDSYYIQWSVSVSLDQPEG